MKSIKLWRGSSYDGLGILFLGWLYGVSIVQFDWLAWMLIGIGSILFLFPLISNFQEVIDRIKSKRTQLGANAALVILLVLVIIGLLDYLSIRHSWRVDTTSQQEFSLSEQTVKILRNLDREVTLISFVGDAETRQMEDRMVEYSHYSGKFNFEIIDPIKEPERVREFFGPEKQYLDLPTLVFKTDLKDEEINSTDEEDITNALIKVTRDELRKVYFLQGHGEKAIFPDEPGMASAQLVKDELEKQHFQVDALNLFQQDEVPQDADVIVIAGPIKQFAESEVGALGRFLNKGGNVLAMLDPETNSGLEYLFADWNIRFNGDMVLESHSSFVLTSSGLNRQSSVSFAPTAAEYGDHMITKNFRFATSFVKAQSLSKINEENMDSNISELVYTSSNSWGETDFKMLFEENQASVDDADIEGPTTLAMAIEKEDSVKTRLVLIGDSDFSADVYVSQAPGNMDFFLNIVSWLAEEEDLISVRPKQPENRPLTMTMRQQKLTLFFLIILLPIVAVRLGIHVYMKRS